MKANNTYNVVIANETCNFTSTKYNTTLTGFTSSEAASNAAREALRDIAGEMGKGGKVFYSETLSALILASASSRYFSSVWYLVAKVVEAETEKEETATTVTVSITEDGNKCEYTANGKVLASIVYRKDFDKYDVNTPSVGYLTDNVTEAHKACESGINHLLNTSAVFDYSAVERYNTVNYPEAI